MDLDKVKSYYISYNLYSFSSGLVGVFMNLFLLATVSLAGVIEFNILYFTGLALAMFGCAYTLPRINPKELYIAGALIRAVTLIFLIAAAGLVSNILVFGLLYGVSIGTFWLGNNILTSDISKNIDRREFIYRNNLISSIVSLAAPTLAGIMIEYSQFSGPLRFIYDFLAAFIFLLASAYVLYSTKLPQPSRPIKFSLKDLRIKHNEYKNYKQYFFLSQLFYMPFSILLPIYIFEITKSYTIAGIYASSLLFVAVFANYITKVSNRNWSATAKVLVAAFIVSSLLLLDHSLVSPVFAIFSFALIYTISSTPLNIQALSNFLEVIDRGSKDRIHFWLNREFYIYTGRLSSLVIILAFLLFFPEYSMYILYAFPIIALYSITYLKVSKRAEVKQVNVLHDIPNAIR